MGEKKTNETKTSREGSDPSIQILQDALFEQPLISGLTSYVLWPITDHVFRIKVESSCTRFEISYEVRTFIEQGTVCWMFEGSISRRTCKSSTRFGCCYWSSCSRYWSSCSSNWSSCSSNWSSCSSNWSSCC
jgi:hypothetical protein